MHFRWKNGNEPEGTGGLSPEVPQAGGRLGPSGTGDLDKSLILQENQLFLNP